MINYRFKPVISGILAICFAMLSACYEDTGLPAARVDNTPLAASITVSSKKVGFVAGQNGQGTTSQFITVTPGDNRISDIRIEKSTGGSGWLQVTHSRLSGVFSVELALVPMKLEPGTYAETLRISGLGASGLETPEKSVIVTYDIPQREGPIKRGYRDKIIHFGQEIILNGANVAWSQDSGNWYNNEIGDVDEEGNPRTNIPAFRTHFQTIANAGGNSARIWLHTGTQTTPVYGSDGVVTGLSRDLTNEQVAAQLDLILDTAWDEGVLVTFSIFSFNMICEFYTPEAAKLMLEEQYQSYIDNALTSMVEGVKYHPALLAWEVFNEPEGMSQTDYFCPSDVTVSTETVQNVVNRTAAAIHRLDPHVKVTTSTHTDLFDRYSNATLTSIPGADPTGTLDFYELHWYNTGWQVSPHIVPASDFRADRPVIIGEYDVEDTGTGGPDGQSSARLILEKGYHGVWPWALSTGNVPLIESAITEASSLSTQIDKAAIEACIASGPLDCYVD